MTIKVTSEIAEKFNNDPNAMTEALSNYKETLSKCLDSITKIQSQVEEFTKRLDKIEATEAESISKMQSVLHETNKKTIEYIDSKVQEINKEIESKATKAVMTAFAQTGIPAPIGQQVSEPENVKKDFAMLVRAEFETGKYKTKTEAIRFCIEKYPTEYKEWQKNPKQIFEN